MTAFKHIDTTAMPWEADPAIPGFKRRLLDTDPVTKGQIKLWHLPPAFGAVKGSFPHRHYHRTVTERAYHLSGDFPHWEFETGADMEGTLVVFRRHIFMDRPPLSIHGRFGAQVSQTGSEILYWNDGLGTGLGEPEADVETVTVEFDERGRADRTNFTKASVFLTAERPWLSHPVHSGWKAKPLAGRFERNAAVNLVAVPMDGSAPGDVAIPGSEAPRWLFVIAGDLTVQVSTDGGHRSVALREGGFLKWSPAASVGFAAGAVSAGGAHVLCIGHDLARARDG